MPKTDGLLKRYLTKNEVCRYIGVCLKSLDKLLAQDELQPIRVLSEYRFDINDIDAWMVANKQPRKGSD